MFTEGMTDEVNIFKYLMEDDGAGGEVQGEPDYLYEQVRARISVLTAEKQLKWFGFAGKELWLVILQHSPNIPLTGDYYLELHYNSPTSVIELGQIYRILKSRHQRDETGIFHHTSLVIERDESAEE